MIFRNTVIPGAFEIDPEQIHDERGFFARTWCEREVAATGLCPRFVQCSVSYNRVKGTLRGMHYQAPPHAEHKLVRCTTGAIYDVALDLRPESPAYRRWVAVELSADNRCMLYLPPGVAHGYQTLTDDAEVFYQISEFYHAESARGVRWNDPAFGIEWPAAPDRVVSARDQSYPDFEA